MTESYTCDRCGNHTAHCVCGPPPRLVHLRTDMLSTFESRPVDWLWRGYVPLGKLTMLDGLPDMGKSTIALDIAARTTVGALMPDHSPSDLAGATNVILFSAEDGIADTVRPRFDAASGNADRVHVVKAIVVTTSDGAAERWPDLSADLDALRAAIVEHKARLVVVDVFVAYIGSKLDTHRDQDVRAVMAPLAAMAEDTCCAILLLRHPTKAGHANPSLAGGGSIGIIGSARVGLLAGWDPDDECPDPNDRRRLMAVAKCNIAAKAPTLAYRLMQFPGDLAAHVEWEGPTAHRAEDLLMGGTKGDPKEDLSLKVFVDDLLKDGPLLASEVVEACKDYGTTRRSALRHLGRLGGETMKLRSRPGGKNRGWAWTLDPPLTDDEHVDLAIRYDRLHPDGEPDEDDE